MSESPPRLSPAGLVSNVARQFNGHAQPPSDLRLSPGSPKGPSSPAAHDIYLPSGRDVPDERARDASPLDSRSPAEDGLEPDQSLSSDPGGSEHSETEEIDYVPDLRRVKVYELVEMQWEDRGTAFCTGDFDDNSQEAKIVAKSEAHPEQILLQHTIRGIDVYQRQQETLIVWTETDGTDYALSFQDVEGCAEVWEFIGEVQRHLNSKGEGVTSSPTIGPEPLTYSQIIQSGRLPQPSLGVIKEVEHAIKALGRAGTAKGRLCEYIINKNYVAQMVDVLHQAEDLESIEDLHALCSCMQAILLLNDQLIFDYILTDDLFEGMCGILEYDPEFPTHKACYRDFLKETVHFRPLIAFQDTTVQRKIHQTYRLQFLKDVVLSRAIDDTTFGVLNSCIIFNQIDIISHIQQDEMFMKQLVGMFVDVRWWNMMGISGRINRFPTKNAPSGQPWKSRSPTPPRDKDVNGPVTDPQRRDIIFLIQQMCVMGKNVQLPARMTLFRFIVEQGVLHALQWALAYGTTHSDHQLTSTAGEVLALLIEHDTVGTRSHILRQITSRTELEKEKAAGKDVNGDTGLRGTEPLLGEMIRMLTGTHDWALKSQMADSLRVMLDSPTESPGLLTALRALRPKDDPNHDAFLDNFYREWVTVLFRPLLQDVPEFKDLREPLLKFTKDQANLYLYLCDLLSAFILQHSFRSQIFLFTSKLHLRVASLLRAKDKHVRLAAVRFFRTCMKIDNPKINMLFDEQEVFGPILEFTLREAQRDNLLSSAAQELFDFIRRENRKDVIRGLVTRHRALLHELVKTPSTSERFKMLISRHEMNVEPPPVPDAPVASALLQKRPLDAGRIAEMEEEAYFNSDEGPSTPLAKAQAQIVAANNMLKRKRMRGNTLGSPSRSSFPRTNLAPLVDYEEEDDPTPESVAPNAGTSTEAGTPISVNESTLARSGELDFGSLGPRPTAKRRRSDEEDEDDGLSRLAARKRLAMSSDDEDELVGGPVRPVIGGKREDGAKRLKLVLTSLKPSASPSSDGKMKDDGG